MRIVFATIAALATLTGTAFAEQGQSTNVSVAHLKLERTADVAALHQGIVPAARTVCGLDEMRVSARIYVERRACVRETVANTIQLAAIPALSELHASLPARSRYA
jgi:UrcA family protein